MSRLRVAASDPLLQEEEMEYDESDDEPISDEEADETERLPSFSWILLPTSKKQQPLIWCRFGNCGETFNVHYQFQKHFQQNHMSVANCEEGEKPCGITGCHFFYNDVDSYRRHLTFHVYHAYLQFCGAEILIKSGRQCNHALEDANNVFYSGDLLQCSWDNCHRTFDDVANFFTHVSFHGKALDVPQEQKFFCLWANCTYGTKRKYEVTTHLRHHSGEKVVACPTCGAFFANKTKLADHCTRQTAAESDRLKCMLCNKVFPSERLLRDHGKRHICRFKCPFCELSLPTRSTLRWHVMHRHDEAKPHVCRTCGRGFKTPLDLERHFSKHSDECEHECRVCGKKFKWLVSMQAHERQHYQVDGKPYVCHLCPKRYRQGSFLSRHFLRVHNVSLPPGHCRFTYKKCADGYFRVITERYESAQLSEVYP